jgi:hypothetical protein
MSSILEELKMMEFVGTPSSEIDIWKNNKRLDTRIWKKMGCR